MTQQHTIGICPICGAGNARLTDITLECHTDLVEHGLERLPRMSGLPRSRYGVAACRSCLNDFLDRVRDWRFNTPPHTPPPETALTKAQRVLDFVQAAPGDDVVTKVSAVLHSTKAFQIAYGDSVDEVAGLLDEQQAWDFGSPHEQHRVTVVASAVGVGAARLRDLLDVVAERTAALEAQV